MYYSLGLSYFGEGDDLLALNLLRKLLSSREDPNCLNALLLASKICGKNSTYGEEGVVFVQRVLANFRGGCHQLISAANWSLGMSLLAQEESVKHLRRWTKQ